MESDVEGKKNLSRIAQACNMAVNALDDLAYSDKYNVSRSDTGRMIGYVIMLWTACYIKFATVLLLSAFNHTTKISFIYFLRFQHDA